MQKMVIEKAVEVGTEKAVRKPGRLFALSVLAGVFISLGGVLSLILGFGFPEFSAANPGLQKLISALAFPIGLFLVVMFGADLFTGNNALLIPAVNERRIGPGAVITNWTMVWIGNFAGALLFTFLMVVCCGMVDSEPYHGAIIRMAETKAALSPLVTFLRGIGANWCVCLAVWLALGADTMGRKALACWIPVAAFVALGYEHAIANMFFIPCGMMVGADVSFAALGKNLFFATLGNIVGGALMVGHFFHRLYGSRSNR
ncbi:MAG: formate/nitrite transporter family protein [Muribaculaceae bacterium]|nr:formate/nitrite transporter family protein [Muribaculaceae bacterium]